MPDDLKTMREAAAKNALAPKEEPMSPQAWREQADSIIAQSGLDDQTLSELRGDPGYMAAWKKGSQAGQEVDSPEGYPEYGTARHQQGPSRIGFGLAQMPGRRGLVPDTTPGEAAQSIGEAGQPWAAPGVQRSQRSKAAEWLGLLEGEMAAVERRMRGEDKPKTTPPEEP